VKIDPLPQSVSVATLQTVLDRLATTSGLSATRKRDLRSAVTSFAKLQGQAPAAIALDLCEIRQVLEGIVPAWAKVSRKRWANLRSDLAAAIDTSGLQPMLKTARLDLDKVWAPHLARTQAVSIHPWSCRHADRNRRGLDKGAC
jgi:hypothetical protein